MNNIFVHVQQNYPSGIINEILLPPTGTLTSYHFVNETSKTNKQNPNQINVLPHTLKLTRNSNPQLICMGDAPVRALGSAQEQESTHLSQIGKSGLRLVSLSWWFFLKIVSHSHSPAHSPNSTIICKLQEPCNHPHLSSLQRSRSSRIFSSHAFLSDTRSQLQQLLQQHY